MSEMEKWLGRTIAGRYQVRRIVGQGGMGAVFEATQQPLGRRVALKVVRRALADDELAVRRFVQEARAVAHLQHPNIVVLHDFGAEPDGALFLAMEFLDGESLRARLRARGRLPWRETLPIVLDVARALEAAHGRGIIHRDLKPDNVVLTTMGARGDFAKVVDFGVAKLVEHAAGEKLTGTGMAVGTPGYIAPEQVNGVGDDPRSDLYALGVLWFEMLTGREPFAAATPMAVVIKHLHEPAPSPSAFAPDAGIPAPIEAIVLRLLAKDPADRPASATALLHEIERLPSAPSVPSATPSTPTMPATRIEVPTPASLATSTATPATALVAPAASPPRPVAAKSRMGCVPAMLIAFGIAAVTLIVVTTLVVVAKSERDARSVHRVGGGGGGGGGGAVEGRLHKDVAALERAGMQGDAETARRLVVRIATTDDPEQALVLVRALHDRLADHTRSGDAERKRRANALRRVANALAASLQEAVARGGVVGAADADKVADKL